MAKKAGIALVLAGTVVIGSALSLLLYNRMEDAQAGQNAENLLGKVQEEIRQTTGEDNTPEVSQPEEMPVVEIDGYGYIGYLTIPALDLELPVMSEWDYTRLKLAPCRQFGSTRTDDLVIAGHNYKKHFGYLSELKPGDTVIFTEMDGAENTYAVEEIKTLEPTQVDEVQNSGYDLVLYTCTYSGATRTTVFCNRA